MRTTQILENTDLIQPDDWCRPLQINSMAGGMSDSFSFKSCYTGFPENNSKWVRVKHCIGSVWYGRTVSEFNSGLTETEFMRGDIPESHTLDMTHYNKL